MKNVYLFLQKYFWEIDSGNLQRIFFTKSHRSLFGNFSKEILSRVFEEIQGIRPEQITGNIERNPEGIFSEFFSDALDSSKEFLEKLLKEIYTLTS